MTFLLAAALSAALAKPPIPLGNVPPAVGDHGTAVGAMREDGKQTLATFAWEILEVSDGRARRLQITWIHVDQGADAIPSAPTFDGTSTVVERTTFGGGRVVAGDIAAKDVPPDLDTMAKILVVLTGADLFLRPLPYGPLSEDVMNRVSHIGYYTGGAVSRVERVAGRKAVRIDVATSGLGRDPEAPARGALWLDTATGRPFRLVYFAHGDDPELSTPPRRRLSAFELTLLPATDRPRVRPTRVPVTKSIPVTSRPPEVGDRGTLESTGSRVGDRLVDGKVRQVEVRTHDVVDWEVLAAVKGGPTRARITWTTSERTAAEGGHAPPPSPLLGKAVVVELGDDLVVRVVEGDVFPRTLEGEAGAVLDFFFADRQLEAASLEVGPIRPAVLRTVTVGRLSPKPGWRSAGSVVGLQRVDGEELVIADVLVDLWGGVETLPGRVWIDASAGRLVGARFEWEVTAEKGEEGARVTRTVMVRGR